MPVQRSCPICTGDDSVAVGRAPTTGEDLRIVVCRTCGLVFANPMFSYQEKLQAGASVRALHRSRSSEQSYEVAFQQSQRRAERCRDLLSQHILPGDRVLEIGSGDGALLALLKQLGAAPTGIDPDCEAARRVERQLQVPVLTTSFEDADFEGDKFDAVVLSHLIEHLFEPVEILRTISGLLKTGGMLFVETPNILRPKVGPRRLFSFAHNYHFSPRTMALALDRAGFRTVAMRVFNRDSFQMVARARALHEPALMIAPDAWQSVARTIRDHKWHYWLSVQFLWRKLPWLRHKMIYSLHQDLSGDALDRWLLPPQQDRTRPHTHGPKRGNHRSKPPASTAA